MDHIARPNPTPDPANIDRAGPADKSKAAALVGAQALLLAAHALLPPRQDWPTPAPLRLTARTLMATGILIAATGAAQLGTGLTPSPLPNTAAKLRTTGLYRTIRHPIYTGIITASLGRTIDSGNRAHAAVTASLILLLTHKSKFEETALRRRFPDYTTYTTHTGRLIPGGSSPPTTARTRTQNTQPIHRRTHRKTSHSNHNDPHARRNRSPEQPVATQSATAR